MRFLGGFVYSCPEMNRELTPPFFVLLPPLVLLLLKPRGFGRFLLGLCATESVALWLAVWYGIIVVPCLICYSVAAFADITVPSVVHAFSGSYLQSIAHRGSRIPNGRSSRRHASALLAWLYFLI